MLCTKCGAKEANFHYKQIINGKQSEEHLCSDCARELGYLNSGESVFDFGNFLNDLISMPSFLSSGASSHSCPVCGTSFEQFKRTGLLGCDKCYDEFKTVVETTLNQIQPDTTHKGKLSGEKGEQIQKQNHMEELKEKLKRAIIEEKYEEAAVIRDKIKELEQNGKEE